MADELIRCACGNYVPSSKACRRSASGRKLSKPQCQDCNEREVRTSVSVREPRALKASHAYL